MPDKRVTELTAIDTVIDTDLVMVIDDPAGTPISKKATRTQLLVNVARTNVSNTFVGDQTVDGDLFVTGEVNPARFAEQKPKIDLFTGTPVGDPSGSRTLLSRSLTSGLSIRHDEALAEGRLSVGNYDTQIYQPLKIEVESFQVHTGISPAAREERVRVHPSGGVTVGGLLAHDVDPGIGMVRAAGVDLKEGVPPDPSADTARLYALDVNGYTQVEMRDGNAKVVRFASDNILIAKVGGAAVTRGQCVYLAGAQGANPLVGLARANSLTTMPAVGVALDSGAVNAFIRVLLLGTFQLLNTSAFAEGDRLYVSSTSAGALTATRPIAPDYAQRVGIVTRSHASQGEMLVVTTAVESDPRQHHTSHEPGGSDALTTLDASTLLMGTIPDARLSANVQMKPLVIGDLPAHATAHNAGGADALTALSAAILTTGALPFARVAVSAASKLLGRGASGAGAMEEITLGTGLTMTGTTLSVAGGALPGNVAYTDAANLFTQNQRIQKTFPQLELRDTNGSANSREWRIGVNGGILSITPYDDAGVEQSAAVMFFWGGSTEWYAPVTYYMAAKYYDVVQVSGLNPGLKFGGATAAFPALRQQTSGAATLEVVSADTPSSAFVPVKAASFIGMSAGTSLPDLTVTGAAALNSTLLVGGAVDITGGSGTDFANAPIEIRMASNPRIGFHWPAVVAAQIGMDSAGVIRTFDNPGTGYAAFAAANIYTSTTGNSLGDLTCRGASNFQAGISVTGNHLFSGYYLYPGAVTNPNVIQSSWYLASHSSYGLYSNTGFYCAGEVWAAGVAVSATLATKLTAAAPSYGPISLVYATPNATHASLTSSLAPAGGTGVAAGGWSTAANRDLAIATINAVRADVTNIKQVLTHLIQGLKAQGVIAP